MRTEQHSGTDQTDAFEDLLVFLRDERRFDFTGYKRASLRRRTDKRMEQVGLDDYHAYRDHLQVHPDEFSALFTTILINVTTFFRDPDVWDHLTAEVLPDLIARQAGDRPLRIWSAGSAAGQEPFSAAMLLAETMGEEAFRTRVKIYATDVDDDALAAARRAVFTDREMEGVSPERRDRHFQRRSDGDWALRPDLRRAVIFGRHDLVQDAPISRIDLLLCRNTLMYFNAEAQSRVVSRLHFSLRDHGLLVLGKAEMLLSHAALFTPVHLPHRVFAKQTTEGLGERLRDMLPTDVQAGAARADDRHLAAAFEASPVAQLVVDGVGMLVHANRHARELFEVTPADHGRPFHDLRPAYQPVDLRPAIDQARRDGLAVVVEDVEWTVAGDETRQVDVEVTPLADGVISLTVHDRTQTRALQRELETANRDLEVAYEELQSTNEELETTNEELHSTVEELETTNEELHSTNEELETMNAELQSTNEELQTINDQSVARSRELDDVNAFLESILGSLDGGVMVVDADLRVTLWSRGLVELWGLRPDEAINRPMGRLEFGLPVEQLIVPVRAVLSGDAPPTMSLPAHDRLGRSVDATLSFGPLVDGKGDVAGAIVYMMVQEVASLDQ